MTIQVNDIIQIKSNHKWGGCIAVVEEVKPLGCLACIDHPSEGKTYVRLEFSDFIVIRKAVCKKGAK